MRPILALLALTLIACGGDDTTTSGDSGATDSGTTDSGTTDSDTTDSGTTDTLTDADLVNGQDIHDNTCAGGYCHGSDTILDDEVSGMSDADLETQITEGGGYMPAQDQLSADDVTDVMAYLRQQFG